MLFTLFVYISLLLFMLLCFSVVRKLSPCNGDGSKVLNSKTNYIIAFASALIAYAFIMGIRYDVGVDHLNYIEIYLYGYRYREEEPLFLILNKIFALCRMPYPIFFGFIALLQISLFCLSFRKEPWLLGWLMIFLLFTGSFQSWNNVIRSSLACCVFVCSLNYLVQKKWLALIIFSLIAIGFHKSAMIIIVVYLLFYCAKPLIQNTLLQYSLLAIAFLTRMLFSRLTGVLELLFVYYGKLTGGYEDYMSMYGDQLSELGSGLGFLFILLINIIVIAYSKQLHTFYDNKKFGIIYDLYFVGLLAKYMIPDQFLVLHRPFTYFYIMSPIIYAYFAYFLYTKKKWVFLLALSIGVFGMYTGSLMNVSKDDHVLYQTYWQHPDVPTTPKYKPLSIIH